MPYQQRNGLRYYQFDIFPKTILNAVFTRQGGFSPEPWRSLNLSISVGDDAERVAKNRLRVFEAMGRDPASLHDVWLVHGTDMVYADAPRPLDHPPRKADIIFTDNPKVSLFMRYADCVPLLFHDPKKGVVGIAHAGWTGTLQGVSQEAIQGMKKGYGSRPADVVVGIGPAIGVDHYEVGEDVAAKFREKYANFADQILHRRNGSVFLDLWSANALQLQSAGVEQIQIAGICTACNLADWFSHRAEKGRTGRFGAMIALE